MDLSLIHIVPGANNNSIGNNSSLPAIISKDKTNLEKSDKKLYDVAGPTRLSPGPISVSYTHLSAKLRSLFLNACKFMS